MTDKNEFIKAMESGGLLEVIRYSESDTQLTALFRVFNKKNWLKVVEYVLARKEGWDAHICQQYFLRGGKLVFGWNFILEAENNEYYASAVAAATSLIVQGMRSVSTPAIVADDPDVVPLIGAGGYRTAKQQLDPRTGLPVNKGVGLTRG